MRCVGRYVVGKTLDGLFYVLGQEEQKIRNNPAAQTTSLLKQVSQHKSGFAGVSRQVTCFFVAQQCDLVTNDEQMVYPDLIVLEVGRNIDACFRNKFKSNLDLLGDRGAQVYPRDS
jgi:hypothetical protein